MYMPVKQAIYPQTTKLFAENTQFPPDGGRTVLCELGLLIISIIVEQYNRKVNKTP